MVKKNLLVFGLMMSLALSVLASVQGKIEGVVTDSSGNPLDKVSVTIVSQKMSSVSFTLSTNNEGKFIQIGITPGYYLVSFKKQGYQPKSQETRVRIAEATTLTIILEKTEEVLEKNVSKADKFFLDGNKLYGEQKYAEAAATYEKAINLSATQWGYYFNLGLAYKKLDIKEEAKAAFAKAVRLSPESYSANKETGEILARLGDFVEATKYYQKAAELSPDDPDALYNLGVCLLNKGDSEAAMEAFLKTVKLKNEYAEAYYQLGTLYISQNKKQEALENLGRFLELAPEHEKAPIAKQLLDYLRK